MHRPPLVPGEASHPREARLGHRVDPERWALLGVYQGLKAERSNLAPQWLSRRPPASRRAGHEQVRAEGRGRVGALELVEERWRCPWWRVHAGDRACPGVGGILARVPSGRSRATVQGLLHTLSPASTAARQRTWQWREGLPL
eukprot:scaffold742_cov395-Prasinococcus_capsulatus_cf.AAC.6